MNDLAEAGEVVRLRRFRLLAATGDALADGDAGAVDQNALLAMGLASLGNRLVDGCFAGDVALGVEATDLLGDGGACVRAEVQYGDPNPFSASARAVAAPSPEAPPVTIAEMPLPSCMGCPFAMAAPPDTGCRLCGQS